MMKCALLKQGILESLGVLEYEVTFHVIFGGAGGGEEWFFLCSGTE